MSAVGTGRLPLIGSRNSVASPAKTRSCQGRAGPIYAAVRDSLVVKVRYHERVINKAIDLALGLNLRGEKELLGLWLAETERAKYWLSVLTEPKNRGLTDIFIATVDGLTGFPNAIEAVYPATPGSRFVSCKWCAPHLSSCPGRTARRWLLI